MIMMTKNGRWRLFVVAMVFVGCVSSGAASRVLLEVEEGFATTPLLPPPGTTTTYEQPSSAVPTPSVSDTTTTTTTVDDDDIVAEPPLPDVDDTTPVVADVATPPPADDDVAPPSVVGQQQQPDLTFFMHDIVGGSHPTVTGVITTTDLNAVPFSKPANNIFPLTGQWSPTCEWERGGKPDLNQLINNNNLPYLTGLNPGGAKPTTTIIQANGNNNQVTGGNNQPFVTAGQLPAGATLQSLMFGTITVIDDELSKGHELGSAVLGKAQGFYIASSLDGTSHTMAITLMFHQANKEIMDTISLFGVHRTVSPHSQVPIVGGTGKYEHAKGYATVDTLPQLDQHTTDGVDSIFQFNVYFSPDE